MKAGDVIRRLGLEPLPHEGGYFRLTWRSPLAAADAVGGPARAAGNAIYALFTTEGFSALHRLRHDETWHFYAGDPLRLLLLPPGEESRRIDLGPDLAAGARPQATVPAGVWQGARAPVARLGWSLVGCSLAPAFQWEDFELGDRARLTAAFPGEAEEIARLTRF